MRIEMGDCDRDGPAPGPAEWPPTLMSCVVGVGGAPRGVAKGNRRLTSPSPSSTPSRSRSGLVGNGIGDRYVDGDSSCSRLCRCDGDANAGVAGVAGATSAPLAGSGPSLCNKEPTGDALGRVRVADELREPLGDAALLCARGVTTPSAAAATASGATAAS